mmetsp:Transcript_6740/g.18555  ORF Transcript_6740/g.18555 Transcript_6740/m.18555 type:complete len:240 (-) Transcript_6740:176-895(-)
MLASQSADEVPALEQCLHSNCAVARRHNGRSINAGCVTSVCLKAGPSTAASSAPKRKPPSGDSLPEDCESSAVKAATSSASGTATVRHSWMAPAATSAEAVAARNVRGSSPGNSTILNCASSPHARNSCMTRSVRPARNHPASLSQSSGLLAIALKSASDQAGKRTRPSLAKSSARISHASPVAATIACRRMTRVGPRDESWPAALRSAAARSPGIGRWAATTSAHWANNGETRSAPTK